MTGVWRVSFSLWSSVNTEQWNQVYIYHNQKPIVETAHYTYSKSNGVTSTGGRELVTRAERGDTFHLGTDRIDGHFYNIIACIEFISI